VTINLIVAAVTMLMAGFVAVWALSPSLRAWMESPKVRFVERSRHFSRVVRDETRTLAKPVALEQNPDVT
jgi:hypothetical protein